MEKIIQTMVVSVLLVALVGFMPVFEVAFSDTVDELHLNSSDSIQLTGQGIKQFLSTFRSNIDIKNHPNFKKSNTPKRKSNNYLKSIRSVLTTDEMPALNVVLLR